MTFNHTTNYPGQSDCSMLCSVPGPLTLSFLFFFFFPSPCFVDKRGPGPRLGSPQAENRSPHAETVLHTQNTNWSPHAETVLCMRNTNLRTRNTHTETVLHTRKTSLRSGGSRGDLGEPWIPPFQASYTSCIVV